MKKPAGSGKRFLIVGLGAVGAALIVPICGSANATPDASSMDSDAATGGSGGAGSGAGGFHGTVVEPSGCAVAGRHDQGGSAAAIALALVGLTAGSRRRRPSV